MIGINMPMPTDCVDCPLEYDGTCPALWASHPEICPYESGVSSKYDLDYYAYAYREKRGKPDWCPLIDLDKKEEPT